MEARKYLDIKDTLLIKLSYERCESYISSAKAILHLCCAEEEDKHDPSIDNLWRLLGLMSSEIDGLSDMLFERAAQTAAAASKSART